VRRHIESTRDRAPCLVRTAALASRRRYYRKNGLGAITPTVDLWGRLMLVALGMAVLGVCAVISVRLSKLHTKVNVPFLRRTVAILATACAVALPTLLRILMLLVLPFVPALEPAHWADRGVFPKGEVPATGHGWFIYQSWAIGQGDSIVYFGARHPCDAPATRAQPPARRALPKPDPPDSSCAVCGYWLPELVPPLALLCLARYAAVLGASRLAPNAPRALPSRPVPTRAPCPTPSRAR